MGKGNRVGGLRLDPAVAKWQQNAAENKAALSKKQRADRRRVRARYDISPELKAAIEGAARDEVGTSFSQFAELLLVTAFAMWKRGELDEVIYKRKRASRSMRFSWDLDIETLLRF